MMNEFEASQENVFRIDINKKAKCASKCENCNYVKMAHNLNGF